MRISYLADRPELAAQLIPGLLGWSTLERTVWHGHECSIMSKVPVPSNTSVEQTVKDKAPGSNVGVRAAQLNRLTP